MGRIVVVSADAAVVSGRANTVVVRSGSSSGRRVDHAGVV